MPGKVPGLPTGRHSPMARKKKRQRDVEKTYTMRQFIAKIRRLADAIENDKPFAIQVASERIYIPKDAVINIEHEREGDEEELEFQIKWSRKK
jgi:amphi-Trp domain-containing protein